MEHADPEQNPLYSRAEDVHPLHWENLGRRPAADAARAGGATWDGEIFTLPFLGKEIRVAPRARTVSWASDLGRPIG
ncbi:MAG: hypothetical protein AB1578_11675, partial [Thermodesulfobacteriota bacterium]